jgi:POT family proton-dependent oligopeptide transporter
MSETASQPEYRTAPLASTKMPPGIPYIVGNEAAERFSFYGMKAILVIFMTRYLLDAAGQEAFMNEDAAKAYMHRFIAAAYFLSLPGSLLADWVWGKYRTIFWLSCVYCLGHLALALDETRTGLFLGLGLIAVGAGGIKPCVSSHVGDQFGASNQHLLSRVFGWFYFSINLGAAASTIATPLVLKRYGPHWAFGIPGVLMLLATIVFWLGRNKFVHIPPGGRQFLRELFQRETLHIALRLLSIYAFLAVFWSLYDQTGSAWVLQAQEMNLHWLGIDWLPSQIQFFNPVLILLMIPLFSYAIYPALEKVYRLTPLRKIDIGLFVTVVSFLITGWVEMEVSAGRAPSIGWHALAYVVMTAAEIMVSITALEFSYTQAPPKLKSFVMALYFLSVSAGNLFTSLVNTYNLREDKTRYLEGADYYWFFAGLMFVAACLFTVVAKFYRGKTYLQAEQSVH